MEFIKMLLMTVGALVIGLTAVSGIYWFFLYTRVGTYALGLLYVGLFYGIYKVITLDMPKEDIW